MIYVLDACAMIAFLRGESGSDVVEMHCLTRRVSAWRTPSTYVRSSTTFTVTVVRVLPKEQSQTSLQLGGIQMVLIEVRQVQTRESEAGKRARLKPLQE